MVGLDLTVTVLGGRLEQTTVDAEQGLDAFCEEGAREGDERLGSGDIIRLPNLCICISDGMSRSNNGSVQRPIMLRCRMRNAV